MKTADRERQVELAMDAFVALAEEEGYRLELSRGSLVREPAPGPRHGRVASRIHRILQRCGEDQERGLVFFDTGFVLSEEPPTVRVPDLAFVSSDRVPEAVPGDQFWTLAPDLVVEVVSPSDSASDIQTKALQYLDAGSGMVWIADPGTETVTVLRSRSEIRILTGDEMLEGGATLPGLEVRVGDLVGFGAGGGP